jgi:cation diffusion facilitator CzcD-associated flavoprotein CzcO
MTPAHDVAVVGAGPYGLATAAHLRAHGLDVHVFGREMEFWERRMPEGMRLRSSWEASSISDPGGELSLDAYQAAHGVTLARPVPLDDFIRYGRWFQQRAVPDLDRRRVGRIEPASAGFALSLDDGERVAARRVVMALGLDGCGHRPAPLAHLRPALAWHSSELRDLGGFAGRRTAIVGAGQSAIELAALLWEAGAAVEVIARAPKVRWLRRSGRLHELSGPVRRVLYPPTDVGPIGLSWLVAVPELFRRVPTRLGDRIAYRCIRPAAASWLVDRTAGVTITLGRRLTAASPVDGGVRLALDDGTSRDVDHLVLATGYRVALDRQAILEPRLRAAVRMRDGAPLLGPGFESSVPSLHFVGAISAASFGPVMRFVSGTPFTARALATHVAGAPAGVRAALEPEPALT